MRVESQYSANLGARGRLETPPRGWPRTSSASVDNTNRLRFWRPLARDVADIICGEGAVRKLPIHAYEALQLMLPASRFAVIDGRRTGVVVHPGQVHVAAPLELNGVESLDEGPCAMRLLLVSSEVLRSVEKELPGPWLRALPGHQQFVIDDQALYAELWALIDEMRGPLVSLSCAPRVLGCVTRLLAQIAALRTQAPRTPAGRQVAGVGRACDHLRTHVADSVSLDELARVAGLSKFYLLRAFTRAHGLTPHAYQMQLRVARAWRLIVDGRALSRTTYDAGFADQSHLTRRFAALFGVTPARYAKQLALPPGAAASNESVADWSAAPPSAA